MLSKTLHRGLALVTQIKGQKDYIKQAQSSKTHVLNFSATWCGPCKAMAPIFQKKQNEAKGKWKLFKVDIDDDNNSELVAQYAISAVPTMVFYKDGKQVHRAVGGMNSEALAAALKKIQ